MEMRERWKCGVTERRIYDLTGVVQGVGFRPTLARLARDAGLLGWVQNCSGKVRLLLDGDREVIEAFADNLPSMLPPNARLDRMELVECGRIEEYAKTADFHIRESDSTSSGEVVIPADLAICDLCAREILSVDNRRYGYPFTTCTACGPRYTVVNAMPYDRERTTLRDFPLCPRCRAEYTDPDNRRFHAESIACPECGPHLWIEMLNGVRVDEDVLRFARATLSAGQIVAVRGIGGFLLAADAFNLETLRLLRERKRRPDKPFAIMARDLRTLRKYVKLTDAAVSLLTSATAPIVIVESRRYSGLNRELLNRDIATIGVMLPTSPLHKLLFEPLVGDDVPAFDLLVMTSGNRAGEPICIGNDEARERLLGIADILLCHDREINLRNDDSLFAIRAGVPQVWRRARGCAPDAIRLDRKLSRSVLAMGAELKNSVAVGMNDRVVLSPHIGDLDTPEAVSGLERVADELPRFLEIAPQSVAIDMHGDMQSSRLGRRLAGRYDIPVIEVQHHHAHAMACMAEHGHDTGLALVMDGTGLGDDGAIWGAELLEIDRSGYRRLATFEPAPLPGGDAATLRPPRQLAARLLQYGLEMPEEMRIRLGLSDEELNAWSLQIKNRINTPFTHAAGRLFDSFSALLGFSDNIVTYEAQAAIRLESAARASSRRGLPQLPFSSEERNGLLFIDWRPAFENILDAKIKTGSESYWALAFHQAVTQAALKMIEYGLAQVETSVIALSGGVFMNQVLSDLLTEVLSKHGIIPLVHRRVPANDGGIAFGQAVISGTGV